MRPEWDEVERHQERVQKRSRRFFATLGVGVVALAVGAHLVTHGAPERALGDLDSEMDSSQTVIASPTMVRAVRTPPTAPMAASRRSTEVAVYECTADGQRVISDHPCGDDAQLRVLSVDPPDAENAARQRRSTWALQQRSPPPGVAPAQGRSSLAGAGSNESACDWIEAEIRRIDALMRQGYTSEAGETFRARLRDLKEGRYDLHCLKGH